MAYQPKSYRKFAATTATAAMVASAVAPVASLAAGFTDVAPQYKDAVDFLVSTGATNGKTETQFGVYEQITRLDAAVILAKVLKLDVDNAKDAGFTDVPKDRAKYVNALVEAGILNGKSEGKFGAYDNLTRVEMAKIIANAYKLEKQNDNALPFTDVNATWAPFVKALYDNGVTSGKTETSFGAYQNITRGDFARFVYRAANLNVDVDPEVVSVSAINPTTLKLEGEYLKNLKAENVTVVGNKVVAITPAADGKSATVTLENKLVPNADVTVSVTVNGEKKDFTTKFEYKVTSVSISDQVFDDDRADQKVTFKINDETVNADIDYLKAAGYDVDFVATQNGSAADIFDDGANGATNTSKTGKLAHPLTKGEYKVEVQISKGGTILVSDSATIKVVNLDTEASAIKSVVFANYGEDKAEGAKGYDTDLTGDDFRMNSTTLVAGEKAEVHQVKATIAGVETVAPYDIVEVTSSAPEVVSVKKTTADDGDGNGIILTAEAKGTATITVKVGSATKTFNFTVTNEVRKLKSVTPSPSTVKVVKNKTASVKVKTTDQYGDPYLVDASDDVVENLSDATLVTDVDDLDVLTDTPNKVGEATLTFTAANKKGKTTVFFQDKAVKPTKTYGTLVIDVTEVDNVGSKKLEITSDSDSTDNKLDLQTTTDKKVKYQLSVYNTNGVFVEAADLTDYNVTPVDDTIVKVTKKQYDFEIEALEKGTTDVVVTEAATGKFVAKVTITVVNDPITIKSVDWKSVPTIDYHKATVNYKNVLTIVSSDADDIVEGITLSQTTQHKVRIVDDTSDENVGLLYLDKDGNAEFDDDKDVKLAVLTIGATADSNFTIPANANSVTGYTTADAPTKDKGTIIFKLMKDPAKPETAIAATSVKVEVK